MPELYLSPHQKRKTHERNPRVDCRRRLHRPGMGERHAATVRGGLRHPDAIRQGGRPAQQGRHDDHHGPRAAGRADDPSRFSRRPRGTPGICHGGLRGDQGPLRPRRPRPRRHPLGIHLSSAAVRLRGPHAFADRPDRAALPATGRDSLHPPRPGRHLESLGGQRLLRSGLPAKHLVPDHRAGRRAAAEHERPLPLQRRLPGGLHEHVRAGAVAGENRRPHRRAFRNAGPAGPLLPHGRQLPHLRREPGRVSRAVPGGDRAADASRSGRCATRASFAS